MGNICLCFSSILSHSKDPGKGGERPGRRDDDRSPLGDSSLVSAPTTTPDIRPYPSTSGAKSSSVSSLKGATSTAQKTSASSSTYLREAFKARGFQAKTCELLCASWREGTQKQYDVYIKKWQQFCAERQADPLHSTVEVILDFLTDLYDKGFSYSAINSARSALSSYVYLDNYQVGNHPLISRLVKGVYQLRTPMPKYKNTWDTDKLVNFFKNQEDSLNLHLKEHTQKLCALLMLESTQRVQTIHLVKIQHIFIHERGCTILIPEKLKTTRPNYHQKPLQIERKAEEKICPVACLEQYLDRTKTLRGNSDNLLVCHSKPHRPASKDTVARWLKEVLPKAGIEGFDAHSFRSASSSSLLRKGVPLNTILEKGGWTNAQTFHRFYNRESSELKNEENQKSILSYMK